MDFGVKETKFIYQLDEWDEEGRRVKDDSEAFSLHDGEKINVINCEG